MPAGCDYDKDGDKDLIVVGEWMKVCILLNDKGFFTDVTRRAGLDETSGWWNCISAADVDGDGDLDLIGGQSGTEFHSEGFTKGTGRNVSE